jgi:hypothetical protein
MGKIVSSDLKFLGNPTLDDEVNTVTPVKIDTSGVDWGWHFCSKFDGSQREFVSET